MRNYFRESVEASLRMSQFPKQNLLPCDVQKYWQNIQRVCNMDGGKNSI